MATKTAHSVTESLDQAIARVWSMYLLMSEPRLASKWADEYIRLTDIRELGLPFDGAAL